jgi:hypothetical protein
VIWHALSVRQPWAFAILHAGKRIENRTWPLPGRMLGKRVLLHASAGMSREEYWAGLRTIADVSGWAFNFPPVDLLIRGAVVGFMTLEGFEAPVFGAAPAMRGWWATDQYGWRLSYVAALPEPVPCKGKLGFWRVSDSVAARVRELAGRAP